MPEIQGERDELIADLGKRVDRLQKAFDDLQREHLADMAVETTARVERAARSIAEKGEAVQLRLDEARSTDDEQDWSRVREELEGAWEEYREAVDRARLELERAEEMT